ncbi:hypothetical protein [[Eubacterium] cellulosolvens]
MSEDTDTCGEDVELCTQDELGRIIEKNRRIKAIPSNGDRVKAAEKVFDYVGEKDLVIHNKLTDNSCKSIEDMNLDVKPSALLHDNGETRTSIDLQKDTLDKSASKDKALQTGRDLDSCDAEFIVDGKDWHVSPRDSVACKRVVSNINDLGPAAKKYLKKHLATSEEPDDHQPSKEQTDV